MPLLVPLALLILAVGVVVARTSLGDSAPSWLRGGFIVVGGVVVFFSLSGLAVLLLIIGLLSLNPPLLWASFICLVLAFVLPLLAWLIARPGLRRQRAAEAERWAATVAQYEAEQARRAVYYEQLKAERLRALREDREARQAARAAGVPVDRPTYDGHGAPVYYEILGVAPDAPGAEIERAYRREMREHHPDRGGESRRAQLINEAYDTLRDPVRRRSYDRENGLR